MKVEEGVLSHFIAKTREKALPFSIIWELTYRCNLECRHCYLLGEKEQELPLSKIKEIANDLAEAGTLFLTLTGGEPLLRSDFFDIVEYLRKKRFAITIFTNGTLITRDIAKRIASFSPWSVEISIYGAKARTHERITRVAGSFEKTIESAKLLKEMGVRVVLKTLWMRENINEARELLDLVEKIGAGFRGSVIISPRNNGDRSPLSLRLTDEELYFLFKTTTPTREDPVCESKEQPSMDEEYLATTHPCGAGVNSARISPNGLVFPCAQFLRAAGDLKIDHFSKIWASSPIFLRLREIHLSDLAECRKCPFFLKCLRCPALAELEEGDVRSPYREACRIAKIVNKLENENKVREKNGEKTLSKT